MKSSVYFVDLVCNAEYVNQVLRIADLYCDIMGGYLDQPPDFLYDKFLALEYQSSSYHNISNDSAFGDKKQWNELYVRCWALRKSDVLIKDQPEIRGFLSMDLARFIGGLIASIIIVPFFFEFILTLINIGVCLINGVGVDVGVLSFSDDSGSAFFLMLAVGVGCSAVDGILHLRSRRVLLNLKQAVVPEVDLVRVPDGEWDSLCAEPPPPLALTWNSPPADSPPANLDSDVVGEGVSSSGLLQKDVACNR